jgi:hypothetical protein
VAVTVEGNLRFVLDERYRIVEASPAAQPLVGHLIGETIWEHFPGSRSVFLPYCEEARRTGEKVEFVQFYGGRMMRVTYVPEGLRLVVTWETLGDVDVTTLDALRSSLLEIVAVLAEQDAARPRRPALRVVEGGS